ncbi:unnamed protein product, partial [Ectocarpus sp. 12 AP-2014]
IFSRDGEYRLTDHPRNAQTVVAPTRVAAGHVKETSQCATSAAGDDVGPTRTQTTTRCDAPPATTTEENSRAPGFDDYTDSGSQGGGERTGGPGPETTSRERGKQKRRRSHRRCCYCCLCGTIIIIIIIIAPPRGGPSSSSSPSSSGGSCGGRGAGFRLRQLFRRVYPSAFVAGGRGQRDDGDRGISGRAAAQEVRRWRE